MMYEDKALNLGTEFALAQIAGGDFTEYDENEQALPTARDTFWNVHERTPRVEDYEQDLMEDTYAAWRTGYEQAMRLHGCASCQ